MPAFKTSQWIRMQIVLTTSLSTLRLGSNYKGKAIIKYECPMFIIAKFNWFGQNSGLKGSKFFLVFLQSKGLNICP